MGTTKSTRQDVTSTKLPQPQQPKSSMAPNSEDPEASPSVQEDQESGGSSAGVVGGVLLALLVAVAAVFGVFYYRRRKERFLLLITPQLLTLPIRESPSILRATKTQISTNTFLQI